MACDNQSASSVLTSTASVEGASINRVAVRIPPFWAQDPEMWFAQVETQFALAGITTEDTKFNYVAGNLDSKYAIEIRDILTSPPENGKYTKLKSELIRRLSASQDQKTRRLLEREEIGDRKPSQFLRHLRGLAGTVFSDDALRSLWLGRLPGSTQAILATQKDTPLDRLAELADAIVEATPRAHIAETTTLAPLEAMFQQLTLLTARIQEVSSELRDMSLKNNYNGRNRSQSRSRYRNRSRSRPQTRNGMCWYHTKFGADAKKCTSPCSYSSEN